MSISNSVKSKAEALGVTDSELESIKGTGSRGNILIADIVAFVDARSESAQGSLQNVISEAPKPEVKVPSVVNQKAIEILTIAVTDSLDAETQRQAALVKAQGVYVTHTHAAIECETFASYKATTAFLMHQIQTNADGIAVRMGCIIGKRKDKETGQLLYKLPSSWNTATSFLRYAKENALPLVDAEGRVLSFETIKQSVIDAKTKDNPDEDKIDKAVREAGEKCEGIKTRGKHLNPEVAELYSELMTGVRAWVMSHNVNGEYSRLDCTAVVERSIEILRITPAMIEAGVSAADELSEAVIETEAEVDADSIQGDVDAIMEALAGDAE